MKKLFGLIISLMVLIPTIVLAEEAYEYFDFKVDKVDGAVIKDADVKIFASVAGDEKNLTDRTDEFIIKEIMWSVCVDEGCATTEEVSDDAVFEPEKEYLFMIVIAAKNGADIDVWGTDRAKLNGTPIDELDGEYGNTGTELMIKSKTADVELIAPAPVPTTGDDIEVSKPEPRDLTVVEDLEPISCMFGFSFCCTTFLGLSLCLWFMISFIFIMLLIIIYAARSGKDKGHPIPAPKVVPEQPVAPIEPQTIPTPEPTVEPEEPTQDDQQIPPVV